MRRTATATTAATTTVTTAGGDGIKIVGSGGRVFREVHVPAKRRNRSGAEDDEDEEEEEEGEEHNSTVAQRRGSWFSNGCGVSTISGDSIFSNKYYTVEEDENGFFFSHPPLHGRADEIRTLKQAYERIRTNNNNSNSSHAQSSSSSELVVVTGSSGVGKSSLVESLRQHILSLDNTTTTTTSTNAGYFVSGKFNALQGPDHYCAIMEAFSDLCDQIISFAKPNVLQDIRKALEDGLHADLHVLARSISGLHRLLGQTTTTLINDNDNNNEDDDDDDNHHHFPHLKKRGVSENDNISSTVDSVLLLRSYPRFNKMCQEFLVAVSAFFHPVVLFLDDFQWANEHAIRLVEGLVQTTALRNMLLVVSYRTMNNNNNYYETEDSSGDSSNDGGENDKEMEPLLVFDRNLDQISRLPVTRVVVGNLDLDVVYSMVSASLQQQDDKTLALSRVVHRKTHGNAYFVTQFLGMLRDTELLVYSAEQGRWDWDVERIQSETSLTDNVVELVSDRIQKRLKNQGVHQRGLIVAAHLGHTFTKEVFDIVLRDCTPCVVVVTVQEKSEEGAEAEDKSVESTPPRLPESTGSNSDIANSNNNSIDQAMPAQSLAVGVNQGLIDQVGDGKYKFSHDRIQMCLYEMVPEGKDKELLQLAIGRSIWQNLIKTKGAKATNTEIFLATDNMNRGRSQVLDKQERRRLAGLNLEAARRAAARAAVFLAKDYLRQGRETIQQDWGGNTADDQDCYQLCLDLFSMSAEIENQTGDFDQSRAMASVVLEKARSVYDGLRVNNTMVAGLGSRGKIREAVRTAFSVLRQLGEPLPKRPNTLHVALELIRVKQKLKALQDDLFSLPLMTNPNKLAAMQLLGALGPCTFLHIEARNTFALVGLRMLRITCQHGLSEWSPAGLSCWALTSVAQGDFAKGYYYGMMAIKLIHRFGFKASECRTLLMLYSLVMHWKRPLHEALDAFSRSHRSGIEIGDVEFRFLSAGAALTVSYLRGQPLPEVEEDARAMCTHMLEFKLHHIWRMTVPMWQSALNLMGRSARMSVLTGEAMDEEEFMQKAKACNSTIATHIVVSNKVCLCYMFEQWEMLAEIVPKMEKAQDVIKLHFSQSFTFFDLAMAYMALYIETGRRLYKKKAKRTIRRVQKWADAGVPHYDMFAVLLKAELLGISHDFATCKKAFDRAIESCAVSSFFVIGIIMKKRAADCMLRLGMADEARWYMSDCIDRAVQWGSVAWVEFLENKHQDLLAAWR